MGLRNTPIIYYENQIKQINQICLIFHVLRQCHIGEEEKIVHITCVPCHIDNLIVPEFRLSRLPKNSITTFINGIL